MLQNVVLIFIFHFFLFYDSHATVLLDRIYVQDQAGESANLIGPDTYILPQDELVEGLLYLPGLQSYSSTGNSLGHGGIGINGSDIRHTNVYIDGMKMNDPTSVDGFFDASFLDEFALERLEIYRGNKAYGQGQGAIGGAINMVTSDRNQGHKILWSEGDLKRRSVRVSDKFKRGHYSFLLSRQARREESLAKNGDEVDGIEKNSGHINLMYQVGATHLVKINTLRTMIISDADTVTANGFPVDSKENNERSSLQFYMASFEKMGTDLNYQLQAGQLKSERHLLSDGYESDYLGVSKQYRAGFTIGSIQGGLAQEEQISEFTSGEKGYITRGANIARTFKQDKMDYLLSTRIDRYQKRTTQTFLVGSVWNRQENDIVSLSYATNIKIPSLYQLYAPMSYGMKIGNDKLKPEFSRRGELSWKKNNWNITIFKQFIDDYIDYNTTDGHINSSWFENSGQMISLDASLSNSVSIRQSLEFNQFQRSENKKSYRRPTEKYILTSIIRLKDKLHMMADAAVVGPRYDRINKTDYKLSPYATLNLGVNYERKSTIFDFKILNLTQTTYTLAQGYNVPERKFRFGVNYYF